MVECYLLVVWIVGGCNVILEMFELIEGFGLIVFELFKDCSNDIG